MKLVLFVLAIAIATSVWLAFFIIAGVEETNRLREVERMEWCAWFSETGQRETWAYHKNCFHGHLRKDFDWKDINGKDIPH